MKTVSTLLVFLLSSPVWADSDQILIPEYKIRVHLTHTRSDICPEHHMTEYISELNNTNCKYNITDWVLLRFQYRKSGLFAKDNRVHMLEMPYTTYPFESGPPKYWTSSFISQSFQKPRSDQQAAYMNKSIFTQHQIENVYTRPNGFSYAQAEIFMDGIYFLSEGQTLHKFDQPILCFQEEYYATVEVSQATYTVTSNVPENQPVEINCELTEDTLEKALSMDFETFIQSLQPSPLKHKSSVKKQKA